MFPRLNNLRARHGSHDAATPDTYRLGLNPKPSQLQGVSFGAYGIQGAGFGAQVIVSGLGFQGIS